MPDELGKLTPAELDLYRREMILKRKSMRPETLGSTFTSLSGIVPEPSFSGWEAEEAQAPPPKEPPYLTAGDFPPSQPSLWQQIKKEVPVFPEFWKMTPEQEEKYIAGGFGLKEPIPSDIAYQVNRAVTSGQPLTDYPEEWQPHIKRLREGFADPTPAREFTLEWAAPAALLSMAPSAAALWKGASALPKAAQIAAKVPLAPLAGAEYLAGQTLKYGIIIPVTRGIPKGAEKVLQFALDKGLDNWLVRYGRGYPQTGTGVVPTPAKEAVAETLLKFSTWIKGNRSWLIEKATDNMLRRQAEMKGVAGMTERAAQAATDDTLRQAEPLLLKAAGIKPPVKTASLTSTAKSNTLSIAFGADPAVGTVRTEITGNSLIITNLAMDKPSILNRTFLESVAASLEERARGLGLTKLKVRPIYQHQRMYRMVGFERSPIEGEKDLFVRPIPSGKVPELPTGVTPRPTLTERLGMPEGMTFAETYAPISTVQRAQITELATDKLLISEFGKPKPQFRTLLKAYTGKTRIDDLTPTEAENVIAALERLPELGYRAGRRVPPSIPRTTEVVPENFFRLKFKRPTPVKHFTSQTYYAQQLGVKPLVEPLEIAKQELDLARVALNRTVDAKGIEIDKLAGTTLGEKTVAKVKNIQTKAITKMGDTINKYEEPPVEFSVDEANLFNWFRNLGRTIRNGENEVRRLLGMEEIPYRRGYMMHVPDKMVQEVLDGTYPLPEGLRYWTSEIVGKRVFNPAARERLHNDLENYFSKDLIYATKSMVYFGLKEIYLSQPLKTFTRQLSALSKDLPIYKTLSAAEQAALRETDVMPASTKKWAIDYVNQVIKGQPTGLDEAVNRMLINRGLAAVINTFLKPFGRSLGRSPITKLAVTQGRMTIAGAMGWRPKQLIRNKFQHVQNLALYGIRPNLKGLLPTPKGSVLEKLMNKSLFLKGYTGMEELPVGAQRKLEKLWLAPFQWTAQTNASQAMKVAFYDTEELFIKPKYKGLGWADPQRTYTEPKGFFYPSEKEKLLKEMEFGAGCTQYQYIGMGMPEVFRNKVLTPLTRLQSWWMNYFFKFHREAITRAFTGKTGYGAKLPWSKRLGWFRYLILGGSILVPMGYSASYLAGVLPSNLAPAGQLAIGLYQYTTAGTDWERSKALRTIYNSWQVLVPGALAFKDFQAVFSGDKPLESLFFYGRAESAIYKPEWAQPPEVAPPNLRGKQKQVEEDIWAAYPSRYKEIAERIKELEETDPIAAKRLQFQYPWLIDIRRQIAIQQMELKRQEALRQREELIRGR